jgi:hypothetical protein
MFTPIFFSAPIIGIKKTVTAGGQVGCITPKLACLALARITSWHLLPQRETMSISKKVNCESKGTEVQELKDKDKICGKR